MAGVLVSPPGPARCVGRARDLLFGPAMGLAAPFALVCDIRDVDPMPAATLPDQRSRAERRWGV